MPLGEQYADIPKHMREEVAKAKRWNLGAGLLCISLWVGMSALVPAAEFLQRQPFSRDTVEQVRRYPLERYLTQPRAHWDSLRHKNNELTLPQGALLYAGLLGLAMLLALLARKLNPYREVYMTHGDAKFATRRDIENMEESNQISRQGRYLHLGYFEGRRISFQETLSALLFAPPGTGKTAGLITPSIVTSDECSMIIYDPKPELFTMTAGHRSRLGPVYRMEWGAIDKPEKGEFHPRYNFLDPRSVPPQGPYRDTYIDTISKVLIADSGGGDQKYFIDKGRAALVGFTHVLVSKVNDRKDPERYENIPEKWHGQDASFPMLVDWINEAQRAAAKETAGQQQQGGIDAMGKAIQNMIDEAITHGYSDRAEKELTPLVMMADRERSGVLGTMDQALIPFKNKAVAERTSASSFTPEELRGWLNPETGKHEPVTIYICVNQADAPAFAQITALFYEVCAKTLLAYGPKEKNPQTGNQMGPYPVYLVLDEFPKLPQMQTVIEIPDVGRSKGCAAFFCAQDPAQIGKIYKKEDQNIIYTTCSVKIVLPQNHHESIELISKMVGNVNIRRHQISKQVGFKKEVDIFGGNRSEKEEQVPLLNHKNLASMPKGKHIIICQGFATRPVWMKTPYFFSDRFIRSRTWNSRTGKGLREPDPMPVWQQERRKKELSAEQDQRAAAHKRMEERFSMNLEFFANTPEFIP